MRDQLDGPGFAAWIETQIPADKSIGGALGESNFRRYSEWRNGGTAGIEVADKICARLDLILDVDVPKDLWLGSGLEEMDRTDAYCSTCREVSVTDDQGKCLWCDTQTVPGKKRGKPVGKYARLSEAQIRQLHTYHLRGVSIRELGRRIRKHGADFASDKAAAMAISSGFRRYSLEARGRGEATAAKNRQRRGPNSPGTADRPAYKRWLRKKAGKLRPCEGVKMNAPQKGRPCHRYAAPGSDFCLQHDPARREEVVATVTNARALIAIGPQARRAPKKETV